MTNLWDAISDLSQKRQDKIMELSIHERSDAALNAVLIGLKGMNQVHGYGLIRLSRLSVAWGDAIRRFYSDGGELFRDYPVSGMPYAGSLQCDVDSIFADLSPRRRRGITRFLDAQRRDAQWNAALIGLDTVKTELHFGDQRMEQLMRQWDYDIRDFYQDRDINEPRLKEWIEDVGFIYENGRLQSYLMNGTKTVKKATMEKLLAKREAENAEVQ